MEVSISRQNYRSSFSPTNSFHLSLLGALALCKTRRDIWWQKWEQLEYYIGASTVSLQAAVYLFRALNMKEEEMQIRYVSLLLPYILETHLKELSLTHTISVKYYPFWFPLTCGFIEVQQMLLNNSLHILNDLNSRRLQSDLNVVSES